MFTAYGFATVLVPVRHDPEIVHGIGIVMAIGCGVLFIRSFRMATISVHPDSIVVRGLLYTRRFSRSDVDAFVTVPTVNLWAVPGNALALRQRNGRIEVLHEFWSSRNARRFAAAEVRDMLNTWIKAPSTA